MTQMYSFAKMADGNTIDSTMADVYQLYFFQKWFNSWYVKSDITNMEERIAYFTEKYYTTYIFQQSK